MADKINNIGKLFYKDYYKEVDFYKLLLGSDKEKKEEKDKHINLRIKKKDEDKFVKINDVIKQSSRVDIKHPLKNPETFAKTEIFQQFKEFKAEVLYPGIVTGVGLDHDVAVTDGYNLGMHFDYTYGMPIVYGSSVKGVLREYFKDFFLKHYPDRESDVEFLMKLIFEGKNPEYDEKKDTPKYISIYERDVFFDAVIVDSYKGHFLEDDFITPHPDPLKNPTPIKMLKIAPGCKIEFRFKLNNHKIKNREYTSDFILKIFIDILTTVGIGAKTNVGYGQLKTDEK